MPIVADKPDTSDVAVDPRLETMLLMPAAFTAAAPEDGKPQQFTMELYKKGYVFKGHYRWGSIVIDLSSFQQPRQDLFALYRHIPSISVGFTSKAGVDGNYIRCAGQFYTGSEEQEPEAAMLQRRMRQGAPYQCSGGFDAAVKERVPEGAKVVVDGVSHAGPITVFRNAYLLEASFAEIGWYDKAVAALAASWPGEQKKPEKEKKTMSTPTLMAQLKKLFGADKAIDLAAAKPDAEEIGAFHDEIIGELTAAREENATLKASITDKDTEITQLKTDLEAAKKAPAVITGGSDAGQPPKKVPEGDLKALYDSKPELKAEFPSFELFEAYASRYPDEFKPTKEK